MNDPIDWLPVATWGLVVVTLALVVVTFVGLWRGEKHAERQLSALAKQTATLAEQATALNDEARASQAIATEMLEARKALHPLELGIALTEDAGFGVFAATLTRASADAIVLVRSELLVGKERAAAAEPIVYGNFYLGGSTDSVYVHETFNPSGRDLVILRVTGVPENGLEQSVEFMFRVQPSGNFERLSTRAVVKGLDEFRARLDEGNGLARRLSQWPPIVGVGATSMEQRTSVNEQYSVRRAEYTDAVTAWNAACRETVQTYLPHRAPLMDRPVVRAEVPKGQDRRLFALREEVQQKIEWMSELQSELEAKRGGK